MTNSAERDEAAETTEAIRRRRWGLLRMGPHDKVATVLRRAFTVLLLLAIMVGAAGVVSLVLTDWRTGYLIDHVLVARYANAEAVKTMFDAQSAVGIYLVLDDDPRYLREYEQHWEALQTGLDRVVAAVPDDAETRRLVEQERTAAQGWVGQTVTPVLAGGAVDVEGSSRAMAAFQTANQEVADRLGVLRDEAAAAVDRYRWASLASMVVAVVLAAGIGVLVARRTTVQLVAPLRRTQQALDDITAGDLAARVRVRGPAEIGAVADSVDSLAARLGQLSAAEAARHKRDQAIREIVRAVQAGIDVSEVVRKSISSVGSAIGADRALFLPVSKGRLSGTAVVWRSDREANSFEVMDDVPKAVFSAPPDMTGGIPGGFVLNDLAEQAHRLGDTLREAISRDGVRSVLAAPVYSGGEVRGNLAAESVDRPRTWTPEDISVVETAAREVGVALARAEVYDRQRQALRQFEELDRERDVFVYTVSHELRTPLTSIVGYLEMVEDPEVGPLNDEQREMLANVSRNAARLQGLVADLLTAARIQAGTFTVDLVRDTLRPVVDSAWSSMLPVAARSGVAMHREDAADDVELDLDPVQADRMLINLLSNAVKFTPVGGEVRLSTVLAGDQVSITVSDSGIGIPAEEQSKLFTRFFRASTARTNAIPGTGLGLSLVAGIVHKHGGRIAITSEVGKGTTAVVRLPLPQPDAEAGAGAGAGAGADADAEAEGPSGD